MADRKEHMHTHLHSVPSPLRLAALAGGLFLRRAGRSNIPANPTKRDISAPPEKGCYGPGLFG